MFNRFSILDKLNIENLTVMSRLKVVKQIPKRFESLPQTKIF